MTVSTSDPIIGRLVDGRYQVRSRIARGGMATVYLATDLRLERKVAIKVMHGHLADDSQFKQRFIQEARSAARLAHPNVVNVFDQGQDNDSAYLVMEYLPGITLRELLQEYGSLTPQQTIDITEAVLSGLAANKFLKSRDGTNVPAFLSSCSRPWVQTRKIVEPGLYSQRATALACSSLMLKAASSVASGKGR